MQQQNSNLKSFYQNNKHPFIQKENYNLKMFIKIINILYIEQKTII